MGEIGERRESCVINSRHRDLLLDVETLAVVALFHPPSVTPLPRALHPQGSACPYMCGLFLFACLSGLCVCVCVGSGLLSNGDGDRLEGAEK